MPPSVNSPVQTRISLPISDGVLGSGVNGSGGSQTRLVGRRRIFVQTDTGNVLGIELDRADSAQTVKKKMQALWNVPTEQTDLVFGDTIFKGDLSEVRNDSPLLLTRELQRSLSTPCICPHPDKDLQFAQDKGKPFEVVGSLKCCRKMEPILKEINMAIASGIEPVAVSGGLGGAYYFRNMSGEALAIVKPTDEEPFAPNNPKGYIGKTLGQPGMKKAVRVGETGVREVAAYLLDHENFAKVPPTVLVKVAHHAFHVNGSPVGCKKPGKIGQMVSKLASCQQFVHHDYDASDHGTSRFSVAAVHRIGILDIRILNTDRHAGNILIRDVKPAENPWRFSNVHVNESLELIPIDHGLCLPEALEDPYFEWLHWPQASLPFSEEELDYISRLNGYEDANILHQELPMLREACYRILILCTTFLKRAAAAGFFLAEIGGMMTRDRMEEASQLELLCMQAKLNVEKDLAEKLYINDGYDDDVSTPENSFADETHEQFEFEMDHDSRYNAGSIADSTKLPMDWTNLSLSDLPSLPVHLSNRKEPTINNLNYFNDFHRSGAYLQICSGMSAPETKRLGSLCKFSACTPNLCNGDSSGFPQSLSLEGKPDTGFPRRTFSERGSRLKSEICPLAEEEEILSFADKNEKSPNSSKEQSLRSPRPTSLRGVSFYNQKKNYTNVSDSKTTVGKVNVSGSLVPFSPGDMSDEQWALFMDHFDNLLEIMLANRSSNVNYCQRLGISCQF